MPYQSEHQTKFKALQMHLNNIEQLRRNANGGNCVLFSFEPSEEALYINEARNLYKDTAEFIDASLLLQNYIDNETWQGFSDYYNDYKDTPNIVFKNDTDKDFFTMIIDEIKKANQNGKIPIIIRTGALYGTGIENQNIMENKYVMEMGNPLVIFYPAIKKDNNILFLGVKKASQYRCQLI